ncbi:MAG TPA: heme ABC transporter ATP-binding protein [candidate division WOR-3 bacterium]|uniref:Heme ABC transporter ATP-binding protein n=1 Tax=candidate division WOR-3 bacterium TaxID=2052148 RepID=A0A9C9EKD7_UNCW3|nr:heme ABC transporter ATP-binding protein [candidate division WOR-3 bacterium]
MNRYKNRILEIKDVSFAYHDTNVLKNISLSIDEGEFLGIIGPNGAGKSTLLRICCGILKPRQGTINLFGHSLNKLDDKSRAKYIAFVPQETHFTLNFTVEEIVTMGRYPYLQPFQRLSNEDHQTIERAFSYADILDFRTRPINSLSSGEKQRVVLARALAQEPRILVLDEPTSHLDLQHQYRIMELLRKLNQTGLTVIIVHHDLNLASLFCRQLTIMHQGQIYARGSTRELINEHTLKEIYQIEVRIIKTPDNKLPQILFKPQGGANEDNNKKTEG